MKLLLLLPLLILTLSGYTQTFFIKYGETAQEIELKKDITIETVKVPKKFFYIKIEKFNVGDKFYIEIKDEDKKAITPDGKFLKLEFNEDIRDKDISIFLNASSVPLLTFTIPSEKTDKQEGDIIKSSVILPEESAEEFILKRYSNSIIVKPFGLALKYATNINFTGANYIHLFYDQYGNSLISTPPQGISGMQYVVHVIYLKEKNNPNLITYSISQTSGSFSDNLEILNANSLNNLNFVSSKEATLMKAEYIWADNLTLLSTSTDDIKFDIYRNILKDPNDSLKAIKLKQSADNTIKMTRVYHANISVGVFNTFLSNPSYNVIKSPMDTSKFVVTELNSGPRAIVSANAILYFSPFLFFKNLRDNKKDHQIPDYMPYGRNILNSPTNPLHKIYPFVGLGLNDTILDNYFFGFAWEIARGSSISFAYHSGKVNIFKHNEDFVYGETLITKEEFAVMTDTRWKGHFALGILLDASIISNLMKTAK